MIRVRFAPSPTGFLHIGGVRTALFNFLYAKNQQGQFLLRIEDTDRERSEARFEKEILGSLEWLGLAWDEKVIRQSERLERYQSLACDLVSRGLAYEESKDGKTAIKFRMPKEPILLHDLVHGEVCFDASLFDDLVILKSDGTPTYHWACVVDDHEMQITHVIRGDDHVPNTPRQMLLFHAMGWKPPKYAHLPLILGSDGRALSKRHGAVSLTAYREDGFLAEGLLNYLALLGWGAEGNQEFFTLNDLTQKFSLKRIQRANARFDREKLEWLNAQHLKKLSEVEYLAQISAYFKKTAPHLNPPPAMRGEERRGEVFNRIALLYRGRIRTFGNLKKEAAYCFAEIETYEEGARQVFLQNKPLKKHLEAWLEKAVELRDFDDAAQIEAMTRETAQGWGIEAKDLIHPLRFALTGKTVSPGLFELMSVLGKETCLKRVKSFLTL